MMSSYARRIIKTVKVLSIPGGIFNRYPATKRKIAIIWCSALYLTTQSMPSFGDSIWLDNHHAKYKERHAG